jgi:elongation factor G
MLREFHVGASVGNPQVAYRETISSVSRAEGKFIRETGGRNQYGHVWLEISPLEKGTGFIFDKNLQKGKIPEEYIPAIEMGVRESLESGALAGYPMVDVQVTVVGGSYDEEASSDVAFKVAASMAMRGVLQQADPVILEPVMDLEVVVPEQFTGDVISDLGARHAQIEGMTLRAGGDVYDGIQSLCTGLGSSHGAFDRWVETLAVRLGSRRSPSDNQERSKEWRSRNLSEQSLT